MATWEIEFQYTILNPIPDEDTEHTVRVRGSDDPGDRVTPPSAEVEIVDVHPAFGFELSAEQLGDIYEAAYHAN